MQETTKGSYCLRDKLPLATWLLDINGVIPLNPSLQNDSLSTQPSEQSQWHRCVAPIRPTSVYMMCENFGWMHYFPIIERFH